MQYQLKRLYKTLAKVFEIASMTIIGILMLLIIGIICYAAKHVNDNIIADHYGNMITIIIAFIVLFIIGFTLSNLATHFRGKLYSYKQYIKDYRQYRVFLIIYDLTNQHRFTEAIDLYTSYLKEGNYKNFLHGYILGCEFHSNDHNSLANGNRDAQKYIDDLKPKSKYNKN